MKKFSISAKWKSLMNILSSKLYQNWLDTFVELIKNSLSGAEIANRRLKMEIFLTKKLPFLKGGGKTLIFLDNGCGINASQQLLERYFQIGKDEDDDDNCQSVHGIGAFSALSLLDTRQSEDGYYILCRREEEKDIFYFRVSPETLIPSDGNSMKKLDQEKMHIPHIPISGSFTMVVIPFVKKVVINNLRDSQSLQEVREKFQLDFDLFFNGTLVGLPAFVPDLRIPQTTLPGKPLVFSAEVSQEGGMLAIFDGDNKKFCGYVDQMAELINDRRLEFLKRHRDMFRGNLYFGGINLSQYSSTDHSGFGTGFFDEENGIMIMQALYEILIPELQNLLPEAQEVDKEVVEVLASIMQRFNETFDPDEDAPIPPLPPKNTCRECNEAPCICPCKKCGEEECVCEKEERKAKAKEVCCICEADGDSEPKNVAYKIKQRNIDEGFDYSLGSPVCRQHYIEFFKKDKVATICVDGKVYLIAANALSAQHKVFPVEVDKKRRILEVFVNHEVLTKVYKGNNKALRNHVIETSLVDAHLRFQAENGTQEDKDQFEYDTAHFNREQLRLKGLLEK